MYTKFLKIWSGVGMKHYKKDTIGQVQNYNFHGKWGEMDCDFWDLGVVSHALMD